MDPTDLGRVRSRSGRRDCPFLWCDNLLNNNDPKVLTFMSKAFANTAVRMAFDNRVMSASDNAVYKQRLASASATGRRFVAK